MRGLLVVVVALAVVVAGCSGFVDDGSSMPGPGGSDGGVTGDNPWNSERVVVGLSVNESLYDRAAFVPALRGAVDFWNDNPAAGYDVTFVARPDAADPDIRLHVVPSIRECEGRTSETTFVLCAPAYGSGGEAAGTDVVRVVGRYTDAETDRLFRHVLGKLAGVENPATVEGVERLTFELRDPWPERDPVVVGVSNEVNENRDFVPLVREAVAYWAETDDRYGNYTADFVVDPDAADPAVVVRFVPSIPSCGVEEDSEHTLGCAPILNRRTVADPLEEVRVVGGYTDESTLLTLKHEFGHLHGRLHGMEPMPIMNATTAHSRTLAQPNVTEQDNPWRTNTVRVFLDVEAGNARTRSAYREAASNAVRYYNDGADGWAPPTPEFVFADSRSTADVVVRIRETARDGDAGSSGNYFGGDPDGDGALEYFSNGTITVEGIGRDRAAWHVGYWLGFAYGLDGQGDLPEPFDDPNEDREAEFWR